MNPDPIPPPDPERMSRVDTAWLRMDNDVNLMMIVGIWLLRPAIAYEALCARVEEKLLQYERFRQKVVQDATGASWVHDPAFDIHRHVVRERLRRTPGESERAALQRRAGELANTPLSSDHPLWQFHLIEGYEGGSALMVRVHHCIGDGIALISVMLSITDGGADPPKRTRRAAAGEDGEWLADLSAKALAVYDASLARSMEMLSDPQQGLLGSLDKARSAYRVLGDVAAMALMPDDSPTLLKGKPGGHKVVAWSEPL
ncbi:MAG TPA: wax ester/triacylglycerol synthase domain-containing protein, partial [Caldimonas sp.]